MTTPYEIDDNNYFRREQPANTNEVRNVIKVNTFPLSKETTLSQIYSNNDPFVIKANESRELKLRYSNIPSEYASSTITLSGGSSTVTTENYYAWGAIITITNASISANTNCTIVINGYKLVDGGGETITTSDSESIREYGELQYEFPDNHLVQSEDIANQIGNSLINSYKSPYKDVQLDWRGNPAIHLTDPIISREYGDNKAVFTVYRNEISFDGTLRQNTFGRKAGEPEA